MGNVNSESVPLAVLMLFRTVVAFSNLLNTLLRHAMNLSMTSQIYLEQKLQSRLLYPETMSTDGKLHTSFWNSCLPIYFRFDSTMV
jgi:hypothetical protein